MSEIGYVMNGPRIVLNPGLEICSIEHYGTHSIRPSCAIIGCKCIGYGLPEDPEPEPRYTMSLPRPVVFFAREMACVLASHTPEKGDSWKTMPLGDLHRLLNKCFHDYWYNEPVEQKDYVDIANVAMMLWHRTKEESE